MFRNAIMLLSIAFLNSCGPALDKLPDIPITFAKKEGFEHTIIGICAAGLSDRIQAELRAKYSRREFTVGLGYEEVVRGAIFDDDDIEGSDKARMYETYVKCVSKSDETQQCQRIRVSCEREYGRKYKDCLEDARSGCINECIWKFGNSRNDCVTEYCDPGPRNIAGWTKKRCEHDRGLFYDCEQEFRSCLLK